MLVDLHRISPTHTLPRFRRVHLSEEISCVIRTYDPDQLLHSLLLDHRGRRLLKFMFCCLQAENPRESEPPRPGQLLRCTLYLDKSRVCSRGRKSLGLET